MRYPKTYGAYKVSTCPFCNEQAYSKNKQGVPVCKKHQTSEIKDFKCACGQWLDMKEGKWGPFFTCINCGIVNMSKALEINSEKI